MDYTEEHSMIDVWGTCELVNAEVLRRVATLSIKEARTRISRPTEVIDR